MFCFKVIEQLQCIVSLFKLIDNSNCLLDSPMPKQINGLKERSALKVKFSVEPVSASLPFD